MFINVRNSHDFFILIRSKKDSRFLLTVAGPPTKED